MTILLLIGFTPWQTQQNHPNMRHNTSLPLSRLPGHGLHTLYLGLEPGDSGFSLNINTYELVLLHLYVFFKCQFEVCRLSKPLAHPNDVFFKDGHSTEVLPIPCFDASAIQHTTPVQYRKTSTQSSNFAEPTKAYETATSWLIADSSLSRGLSCWGRT